MRASGWDGNNWPGRGTGNSRERSRHRDGKHSGREQATWRDGERWGQKPRTGTVVKSRSKTNITRFPFPVRPVPTTLSRPDLYWVPLFFEPTQQGSSQRSTPTKQHKLQRTNSKSILVGEIGKNKRTENGRLHVSTLHFNSSLEVGRANCAPRP